METPLLIDYIFLDPFLGKLLIFLIYLNLHEGILYDCVF